MISRIIVLASKLLLIELKLLRKCSTQTIHNSGIFIIATVYKTKNPFCIYLYYIIYKVKYKTYTILINLLNISRVHKLAVNETLLNCSTPVNQGWLMVAFGGFLDHPKLSSSETSHPTHAFLILLNDPERRRSGSRRDPHSVTRGLLGNLGRHPVKNKIFKKIKDNCISVWGK